MTLFNDINIQTITEREEVWLNLIDLTQHLTGAINVLTAEVAIEHEIKPLEDKEKYFMAGLIEGMKSIALLLVQGKEEFDLDQIKNVEDLFKTLDIDKDL